jgi:hypothetical protein
MTRSTNDLIAQLADQANPVGTWRVAWQLTTAALAGVLASITVQLLTIGVRQDAVGTLDIIVTKLMAITLVAAAWAWLLRKLASPGSADRLQRTLAAGTVAVFLVIVATGSPSWSGVTRCVTQVLVLALPAFVILVVAVRRCAPTDLVQAGIAVGMLAGAIGVLGYSLGCTADDPTVVAWRYGVAILVWGLIGGALGKVVLRW